jgi:predicted transposase YdaD
MPDMTREKVIRLTNPFIELGIHRGRQEGRRQGHQEGRQQGETELVLRQLKRRLGSLTAEQEEAVRLLTLRCIEALGEALLEFNSRADLDGWLKSHSR